MKVTSCKWNDGSSRGKIVEYLEIRLAWPNFDYVNFSESSHQGAEGGFEERVENSKYCGVSRIKFSTPLEFNAMNARV